MQGCIIAAATGGFASYHVDTDGSVLATAPAGCQDSGLTWRTTARPAPGWPANRYLLIYEGTDHGLTGPTGQIAIGDALQFLVAHTPAP